MNNYKKKLEFTRDLLNRLFLCSHELPFITVPSLCSRNSTEDNDRESKSCQNPYNPSEGFQRVQLTTIYKMAAAIQTTSKCRSNACGACSPKYPSKRQEHEMARNASHDTPSCRVHEKYEKQGRANNRPNRREQQESGSS